ncbi:MAG: hypothetical protein ACW98K_18965 [Candidatus Kariarchaeaceae archaeon]|jgi:hypothetical protein
MKLESRINNIATLVIGIIFILVGVTLDDLAILEEAINWAHDDPDQWYIFLKPWIGDGGNGIPVPWEP